MIFPCSNIIYFLLEYVKIQAFILDKKIEVFHRLLSEFEIYKLIITLFYDKFFSRVKLRELVRV